MSDLFDCFDVQRALKEYTPRAVFLKMFAAMMKIEVNAIAEIGVYLGENAKALKRLFPDATLYLIDPWEITEEYVKAGAPITCEQREMDAAFFEVLHHFSDDENTHILRHRSADATKIIQIPLDLVYIDGDHSYECVVQDIRLWQPKVRAGGMLAGHDYNNPICPGVKSAVDDALGDNVFTGLDHTWVKIM